MIKNREKQKSKAKLDRIVVDVDDRPVAKKLLANLKKTMPQLRVLLNECNGHWVYEDAVYRLYHSSFKVYGLQQRTEQIVDALRALSPGRLLNDGFMQIVSDGTGKKFKLAHNKRWLAETRPIVEAYFHARFFLEMAVRYGLEFRGRKAPPLTLPSGWAAFLYLYNVR